MTTMQRAMLGDKEAQRQITERGELLPCPMCHGEDLTITGDGQNIYDPGTLGYVESVPDTYLCIVCDVCGLISNAVDIVGDDECGEAERQLAEDWNTRAPILTMEQINALEAMEHDQ